MAKFRSAGEFAAYEIAEDIDNAEDAEANGLIAVENDPTTGVPVAFGRYKPAKAPKAAAGSEA